VAVREPYVGEEPPDEAVEIEDELDAADTPEEPEASS
jgi:hypothetical protein